MARAKPLPSLRLVDHDVDLKALTGRQEGLRGELDELRTRSAELARSLASRREGARNPGRTARVRALLFGTSESEGERPDELAEIKQRIGDLEAAIFLLSGEVSDAKSRASAAVREQVRDHHARLVLAMAEALLGAYRAAAAYAEFTDALNAEGVAWSELRHMYPQFLGQPTDPYGPLAQWLEEAARYGFLDEAKKPEALRK